MPSPINLVIRGKDSTQGAFASVNRGLGTISSSLGRLAGAFGLAFGAAGALSAGRSALDLADKVGKLNARLGISTEALSQYGFVAEQSGLRFETLTMGLQRLQRRVAEAAVGTGEARGALLELGIDAEKLTKLPLDQQFETVAQALSEVGSEGDRTRLAMKLFDSAGVALLQTMGNGAAGIQALRAEADQLGRTLGQDDVAAAEAANDAMNRVNSAFQGLTQQAAVNLAPALTDVANFLASALPTAANFTSNAFNVVRTAVGTMASFLIGAFATIAEKLGAMMEIVDRFTRSDFAAPFNRAAAALRNVQVSVQNVTDDFWAQVGAVDSLQISYQRTTVAADQVASAFGKVSANQAKAIIASQDAAAKAERDVITLQDTMNDKLGGGIADAITGGMRDGAKGVKAVFLQMLEEMAADLLRSQVVALLKNLGGGSSGGGGIGGIFGFISSVGSAFAGAGGFGGGAAAAGTGRPLAGFRGRASLPRRAAGGPTHAGGTFLVGERGPELLQMGSQSGRVVPNDKLGGVTVNQSYVVNVQGRITAAERLDIDRALANNRRLAVGDVIKATKRGQL